MKKLFLKALFSVIFTTYVVHSTYAQLWLDQRADELFNSSDYTFAIKIYSQIKTKKLQDWVNTQIARSYFQLKDFKKAEEFFSKVQHPEKCKYEYLYRDLALCYLYQGRYTDAENTLKKFEATGYNDPMLATYYQQINAGKNFFKEQAVDDETVKLSKTNFDPNGYYLGSTVIKGQWVFAMPQPKKNDFLQYETPNYGLAYGKWNKNEWKQDSVSVVGLSKFYFNSPSFDSINNVIFYSKNVTDTKITKKKKMKEQKVPDDRVNHLQIYYAPYGKWNEENVFVHNKSEHNFTHPVVWNKGNALIFASDMPGGLGGYDLYVSYKNGSTWSEPINLGNQINSVGDDMYPYVWGDTVLFFASNGRIGWGGADIYRSNIDLKNRIYTEAKHLGGKFNSPADDFGLWMSSERTGYFASNRELKPGKDDIYAFEIPEICYSFKGQVFDKVTLQPLANSKVKIYENGNLIGEVITDNKGYYTYPCIYRNRKYNIEAEQPKYTPEKINFEPKLPADITETVKPMYLNPIVEKNMVFTFNDILFEYNKADLLSESMIILDRLATLLLESNAKVELSAHTDSRGNDNYNQKLSQRRAESCVNYLITKGVQAWQLIARGYGEKLLKNGCGNNVKCTEDEHAVNRRVEIKILDVKK